MVKFGRAVGLCLITGCLVAMSPPPASAEPSACPTTREVTTSQIASSAGCNHTGKLVVAAPDLSVVVPERGETAGVAVLRQGPSRLPSTLYVHTTLAGQVAVSTDSTSARGEGAAARALDAQLKAQPAKAKPSVTTGLDALAPTWCGSYTQYKIYNYEQPSNGYYQWYYRTSGQPSTAAYAEISAGANNWVADSSTCASRPNDARHLRINTTTRAPNVRDDFSVVGWASLDGGTLAVTNWWWSGNIILEADMRFDNSSRSWHVSSSATVASGRTDLRSVAAHEFGHAFGFDHATTTPAQIMYPSIGTGVERRVKRSGDLYGMQLKY